VKYILKDGVPVKTENLMAWAEWFETADRTIEKTILPSGSVSTVFLALDHCFNGGPPVLYETMIFCPGLRCDEEQRRYSSLSDARDGHQDMVQMAEEEAAETRREGE